jgi:hypothetical protein
MCISTFVTMCATPKGTSRERIQAEFTSLMVDKYGEHDRIYTDGISRIRRRYK